jgi:hypothetical protein
MEEHYWVSYGLNEAASVTVDKTFMFREDWNDKTFSGDQSHQSVTEVKLLADPVRHTIRKFGLLPKIDTTDPSIFYSYISDY